MVIWASLVTQTVKNMPATQETQVRPLGHGLPCPPPGDLPIPEVKSVSLESVSCIAGRFFTTEPPGKHFWANR